MALYLDAVLTPPGEGGGRPTVHRLGKKDRGRLSIFWPLGVGPSFGPEGFDSLENS